MDEMTTGALSRAFLAHSASRWPLVLGLFWGFFEATAFFVVPDVYLVLVALLHWRRGLAATAAAVAGAVVGGALIYSIARADPRGMDAFLAGIPLIRKDMLQATGERMRLDGLISMLNEPLQGVPFKVYAAKAGELAVSLPVFLLMTIPARLSRILPGVLLAAGLGTRFRRLVHEHIPVVFGGHAALWMLIYFLYYLKVG